MPLNAVSDCALTALAFGRPFGLWLLLLWAAAPLAVCGTRLSPALERETPPYNCLLLQFATGHSVQAETTSQCVGTGLGSDARAGPVQCGRRSVHRAVNICQFANALLYLLRASLNHPFHLPVSPTLPHQMGPDKFTNPRPIAPVHHDIRHFPPGASTYAARAAVRVGCQCRF